MCEGNERRFKGFWPFGHFFSVQWQQRPYVKRTESNGNSCIGGDDGSDVSGQVRGHAEVTCSF